MKGDSLESVESLEDAKSILGDSSPADYIARYVKEIGCRTVVVERDYIDKDYLADYANYHCRSHIDPGKNVTRLHFFEKDFKRRRFVNSLSNGKFNQTCGNYLGFSIVKPIYDSGGNPIIGRTALRPYPLQSADGQIKRHYIANEQKVSLFGQKLHVNSVPFQVQDGQVCKCATVALWSASDPLKHLFGTPTPSPSDITERATSFPTLRRRFPSEGLILEQMLEYVKFLGLEKDVLVLPHKDARLVQRNVRDAKTAIKAYVQAGIPIIAGIRLIKQGNDDDLHAVVITGFGSDSRNELRELYVHDDQVGPYCRADWSMDGLRVVYEWTDPMLSHGSDTYDFCEVEKLIVPVYPKIRLPSSIMTSIFEEIRMEARKQGFQTTLMYSMVGDFKARVAKEKCVNVEEVLLKNLPKYLAVVSVFDGAKPILDYVYDATGNSARKSRPLLEARYSQVP